ncbi:HNH endonuclease [Azospirillum aestuarii]|uniref:HNH endonuclease n=1 Tax=Azospirillum aestuarii TaxID=2802052 RepID=UPI004054F175
MRAVSRSKSARRRQRLAGFQDSRCFLCGKPLGPEDGGPDAPSTHHFIPLAKGGPRNALVNQVVAHRHCNQQAGDRMPTKREWGRYLRIMWARGFSADGSNS